MLNTMGTWPFKLIFMMQAMLIIVDEFYFHRRRVLPKWERVGHPIDTAAVLICVAYLIFSYSPSLILYSSLCFFSCLLITKDEWVHLRHCPPGELWTHACLFIIHPMVFWACWELHNHHEMIWLNLQAACLLSFMIYQGVYWNVKRANELPIV